MPEEKTKKLHFSKREAIDFGYEGAKKNIVFFIGVFAIFIVVASILQLLQTSTISNQEPLLFVLFYILIWIVQVIMQMGLLKIPIMFVEGKKPQFKNLFYTKSIINYILAGLIRSIIVVIGLILLIIPGIIFSIKLTFVEYLVVDKGLGPIEAVKKSWEITKGVKWDLLLFMILLGLINILGVLCLVVGLFVTIPLSMLAMAFVYRKLLSQTASK